ncbi:MAG: hypothetical protein JSW14_06310, partial [Candidatus Bathyarchaeum sp.]
ACFQQYAVIRCLIGDFLGSFCGVIESTIYGLTLKAENNLVDGFMVIVKCHWFLCICSNRLKVSSHDDNVTSEFNSIHSRTAFQEMDHKNRGISPCISGI